jgi:hypothetical protein
MRSSGSIRSFCNFSPLEDRKELRSFSDIAQEVSHSTVTISAIMKSINGKLIQRDEIVENIA